MKETLAEITDRLGRARALRDKGDRLKRQAEAAAKDGDYTESVNLERQMRSFYRQARALEFKED